MNSLRGLLLGCSEYRRGILGGGMCHFGNSFGLVLSRKLSVTFNHFDFFPSDPLLRRADIKPCHRQPESKRIARRAVKRRLN